MRLFRLFLMLVTIAASVHSSAQKFRISSPPVDGYFYLDTIGCQRHIPGYATKCVDIICDNNTVYASGDGKVLFCYTHGDRTYEIGVKYDNAFIVYNNIKKKAVQKNQPVHAHTMIGELAPNPKDKLYHLGLQVAETPGRFLWYNRLAGYLNAQLVVN